MSTSTRYILAVAGPDCYAKRGAVRALEIHGFAVLSFQALHLSEVATQWAIDPRTFVDGGVDSIFPMLALDRCIDAGFIAYTQAQTLTCADSLSMPRTGRTVARRWAQYRSAQCPTVWLDAMRAELARCIDSGATRIAIADEFDVSESLMLVAEYSARLIHLIDTAPDGLELVDDPELMLYARDAEALAALTIAAVNDLFGDVRPPLMHYALKDGQLLPCASAGVEA